MQGKVVYRVLPCHRHRITPACAGKSSKMADNQEDLKDHPCVCREKDEYKFVEDQRVGSPLRVQGKVDYARFPHPSDRITPACAGKS